MPKLQPNTLVFTFPTSEATPPPFHLPPHHQLSAACTNIPAHIALSPPLLQLQAQTKEPRRQLLGHAKPPAILCKNVINFSAVL